MYILADKLQSFIVCTETRALKENSRFCKFSEKLGSVYSQMVSRYLKTPPVCDITAFRD